MLNIFARQAGKKLLYISAASALTYSYLQECKNDVIYFTKTDKQ